MIQISEQIDERNIDTSVRVLKDGLICLGAFLNLLVQFEVNEKDKQ